MADRIIQTADLSTIGKNLEVLSDGIRVVHEDVVTTNKHVMNVDSNVRVVYDEVEKLKGEFLKYVDAQLKANRLQQARTTIISIRQELEKEYGHYDEVRRSCIGILQATDLELVRKGTISTISENLLVEAPRYWLAPCLVALAAWISDDKPLADRAVKEAIHRDDEKTSLFFSLVTRRADRKQATLQWVSRFMENQDSENLNRNAVIILDAYASGLLGQDTKGLVTAQMEKWLNHLKDKPGFVETQRKNWASAILLKKKKYAGKGYTYLPACSSTWPQLSDVMAGAILNTTIYNYFDSIYKKQSSTESLKEQLDQILETLVTEFDEEELPWRKKEKFEQLIIDNGGDEKLAQKKMKIEETAFEEKKDFTQLLTDSAMKPEISHASPSTQKFAISLSKEWILEGYQDVVAGNRANVPDEINLSVDGYSCSTRDGENENELIEGFKKNMETVRAEQLAQYELTAGDTVAFYGGIAIAVIGLIMLVSGSMLFGLIAVIAGCILVVKHISKKNAVEKGREAVNQQINERIEKGTQALRALCAEVVDFRAEFAKEDAVSAQVLDFLEAITPSEYVKNLTENGKSVLI